MPKHHLIALGLSLSALIPTTAHASACDDYAIDIRQTSGSTYDPASMAGVVLNVAVTAIDADLKPGCTSRSIKIEPQAGGNFIFAMGGDTLNYSVQNSNHIGPRSANEISLNGNARNTIVAGSVANVPLFAFQSGQFVRAGRYIAPINVTVGNAPPLTYELAIDVEPSIRFVAENGAREKTLSFGDVTGGSERSSAIYYRTNAAFQLRATSQNRGTLLHESGAQFGSISYQTTYDGAPIDLATGMAVLNRTYSGTSVQSDLLRISIQPQSDKFAGKYRDVLTLEFIPF